MPPTLVGSTFVLAETAIANSNSANKPTPTTCTATAGPNTLSQDTHNMSSSNDRLPDTKSVSTVSKNELKATAGSDPATDANLPTPIQKDSPAQTPYKLEIVWFNVMLFAILHISSLYGIYLIFAERAYIDCVIHYGVMFLGGLGVTAGAHRLWSHRAYKARLPLRIFLMFCQSLAFQNHIYEWSRDHRVHHKFTDTNADPHNSRRGFFFAHMGWLMCRKHPDVKEKGKLIDMSDLEADSVVMFQKRYYFVIMPLFCFVLPTLLSYLVLGSSLMVSFFSGAVLRYTLSLHGTWLVNSAAHFYGMKPYDRFISSVDNRTVSIITFGEGWHNYHHVFPWDYKAAELGNYYNWTTRVLDFMAKIGQAYDLKFVPADVVLKRVRRTGDGSHPSVADKNNNNSDNTTTTAVAAAEATAAASGTITDELVAQLDHNNEETLVWGWGDNDVREQDRRETIISAKKDD